MTVAGLKETAQMLANEIEVDEAGLVDRDRDEPWCGNQQDHRGAGDGMEAADSAAQLALPPEKDTDRKDRNRGGDRAFSERPIAIAA